MDLDCYYIPRVEETRREKVLQCLCCQKLDSHMVHEYPKKSEIKVCSICAGRGHTWKVCEMGDRPEKHKCLNCNGNHISTAKSCPERKRIINRRNRSKSRNQWNRNGNNRNFHNRNNRSRSRSYNKNRRINSQKSDLREEIEQKKTATREYQEF